MVQCVLRIIARVVVQSHAVHVLVQVHLMVVEGGRVLKVQPRFCLRLDVKRVEGCGH